MIPRTVVRTCQCGVRPRACVGGTARLGTGRPGGGPGQTRPKMVMADVYGRLRGSKYSPLTHNRTPATPRLKLAGEFKTDNLGARPSSSSEERRGDQARCTRPRTQAIRCRPRRKNGEMRGPMGCTKEGAGLAAPARGPCVGTGPTEGDDRVLWTTANAHVAFNARPGSRSPAAASRGSRSEKKAWSTAPPRNRAISSAVKAVCTRADRRQTT